MKNLKNKMLVGLLGVLLTLVTVECTLRLVGYLDSHQRKSEIKSDSNAYRITFLGNSHTYGSGAPKGMGFPEQLEKILNSTRSKKYQVFNRGYGNVNSAFILENLPFWLSEDRPQVVFVMTGEPNTWNKYGYLNRLKVIGESNKASVMERLDFLRWSRIYRLVELFINRSESWNENPGKDYSNTFRALRKITSDEKSFLAYTWLGSLEEGASFTIYELSKDQLDEAIEMLAFVYDKDRNPVAARLLVELHLRKNSNPNIVYRYLESAVKLEKFFNYPLWSLLNQLSSQTVKPFEGKLDILKKTIEEKKKFKQLSEIDKNFKPGGGVYFTDPQQQAVFLMEMNKNYPSHVKTASQIWRLAKDYNPDQVLEALLRTLEVNPLSPSATTLELSENILKANPHLHLKYDDALKKIYKMVGGINPKGLVSEKDSVKNWIISDLEKIIEASKKSGATVVVQTYPPFRDGSVREVDLWLREWWVNKENKEGIKLQDIGEELKKFFENKDKESFYANDFGPTDNHLNQKGYEQVAKLIEPIIP